MDPIAGDSICFPAWHSIFTLNMNDIMQYYFLCVLSKVFDNPQEISVLFSYLLYWYITAIEI